MNVLERVQCVCSELDALHTEHFERVGLFADQLRDASPQRRIPPVARLREGQPGLDVGCIGKHCVEQSLAFFR